MSFELTLAALGGAQPRLQSAQLLSKCARLNRGRVGTRVRVRARARVRVRVRVRARVRVRVTIALGG